MANGSSPPYNGAHEQRLPECIETFTKLNTTLDVMASEMRGMRKEVRESGKVQAGFEQSVKGLWHEVRDELKPDVKEIATGMKGDLSEHEKSCPARRRAMRKAESIHPPTPPATGVQIQQDEKTGAITIAGKKIIGNSSNGHYEIPRPVLWIGALIGAAITASGYLYQFLQSLS